MELNFFRDELIKALISRGVPDEAAARHADKLCGSFDADDINEITAMDSSDEIEALASSAAAFLMRKKSTQPTDQPAGNQESVQPRKNNVQSVSESDDDVFDFEAGDKKTKKGKTIFLVGLIVTLPITLALLLLIYGTFAALFLSVIVLIIALIAAMIAVVAGGAVISLVGIIYGITQLFSCVEAGIYEIGLGIIVVGVVLLLAVLIFNLAVRVVPILITKLAQFVGFVTRKLKSLFYYIRRECYKL